MGKRDLSFNGGVTAGLLRNRNEDTLYSRFVDSLAPDSDAGRFMNDPGKSAAEKKKVFMLSQEINLIMNKALYRDSAFDAFELPARLAAESGNLEAQQLNCGMNGSKVNNADGIVAADGIVEQFGGKNVFKFCTGAAKFAKS